MSSEKDFKYKNHRYSLTMISDRRTPGAKIALRRKERGLTQKRLSTVMDIPWRLISDYERGKLRLNDKVLRKFSEALEISADEILGLQTNKYRIETPSLRLMKRVNRIKDLPIPKQKALLQIIDGFLKSESI